MKNLIANLLTKSTRLTLRIVAMLLFTITLCCCSDSVDDLVTISENQSAKSSTSLSSPIVNDQDAIEIANKVLKKVPTRGFSVSSPSLDYVVNDNPTRSNAPDTLAYIVNYPNDGGFVIVATDRRIYPILAFSEVGNFNFDNEIAKANFIDNIGTYMEENLSNSSYDVSEDDFDGCFVVYPMVEISMGQNSPWNKYVIEDHPNCPVGCVAVATALVMSHSKYQIRYHNTTVYLKSIIDAIKKGPNSSTENAPKRIIGGHSTELQPTYTYEEAVDLMATLLYDIGKDLNMQYNPKGSSAYSSDAYKLCRSLNFNIPTEYNKFDINEISWYLKNNHIVYLSGYDINGKGGHAWVSDACYFCVDSDDPTQITETYIRCDWGWNGYCNGYYSGSVFEAASYNFQPNYYFAIKREWE
ncbi:MAG: C10 family peptidase [Muribaculaceae bacterium]|nr:C10 family peptidase [Muribaculaceae bacterium]